MALFQLLVVVVSQYFWSYNIKNQFLLVPDSMLYGMESGIGQELWMWMGPKSFYISRKQQFHKENLVGISFHFGD